MKVWNWIVMLCLLCGAVGLAEAQSCSPLTVTATLSSNNQKGLVGTTLKLEVLVQYTLTGAGPAPGINITWAISKGVGTLSAGSSISNSVGLAETSLTLTSLGPVEVTAEATCNQFNQPAVLNATAVAPVIAIDSGDAQTGAVSTQLPLPFVVMVTAGGLPVPNGTLVTWTVTSGGGTLSAGVSTTTGGLASKTLTLGSNAGPQTVTATVAGGNTVTFSAMAVAPPIIAIVSGNNQTGTGGVALGSPFVVRVTQGGATVPDGTQVTWTVTSGGGTLLAGVTATSGGQSSNSLTLGPSAGTQTVTATVAGGNTVTFSAMAVAPPIVAIVSGNNQMGTGGVALGSFFVVRVTQGGATVPDGTQVTWTVTSGGGTLLAGVTATSGGQSSNSLTLGPSAGTQTVIATVAGGNTVTFSAMAVAPPIIAIVSGNNQTGTGGAPLGNPFVVNVTQGTSPAPNGTSVTWTVTSGGGTLLAGVTATSGGQSSNSLTLGPSAGTQTVIATVAGGNTVTFSAMAVAPPIIAIVSGNNQTGTGGAPLGNPFVVNVTQDTSPAPNGTSVTWTVTSGGGTLPTGVTTTTAGQASNTLTLGRTAGTQTVTASVAGGSTVTFSASATALPMCPIVVTPSTTVIAGAQVSLTSNCQPPAGGNTSYSFLWSTGQTTPSITVTPNATTVYNLTVTILTGTVVTGTVQSTVTINVATGALNIISGNNQAGAPGQTFALPLVVQAILSTNQPLSGQSIVWTVVQGTGSVSQVTSITDASGLASTQFTAGPQSGVQKVRASLGSLTPVEFVFNISEATTCDITPTPSATVVLGTRVTLTANCSPAPPPGTTYAWNTGDKTQAISVTPTSSTTYSVTVTLPTGSPIQKTIVIVVNAGTLAIVSGNNQAAMANSSLAAPLSVRVTDNSGAAAAGIVVAWQASQATDVLGSPTTATDQNGIATNTLKLGAAVGTRTVSATIPGGKSVVFAINSAETAVVQPAQSLTGPLSQSAIVAPQVQLQNINARLDELRLLRQPGVLDKLQGRVGQESISVAMLGSLFGTVKLAAADASAEENVEPPTPPKPPSKWGFFVNGDFGIDKQDTVNTYQGYKLRTDGLTVGADYRFENNNILGGAIGYIKGDTSINGGGAQDTTGFSFSMYGALVPSEKTYINAIASYGHNRYKTQRITGAGDTANGSTQGNQYALSVSAGYNFNKDAFIFNPYGRADLILATVDAFSESGGNGPIQVSRQRIQSTVFSLGGQASYTIPLYFATVIPTARVEFQQQTSSAPSNVTAGLVGDPLNTSFAVPYMGQDKSYGNFGVGVLAIFKKGVSATFNYEQLFGKENYSSQRYLLGLRVDLP